jgi:hypothetical protein
MLEENTTAMRCYERVLQVAKRELKELYDLGQCDVYFEFRRAKQNR